MVLMMFLSTAALAATLSVRVTGISKPIGDVIARVHNDADSFPMDPSKEVASASISANGSSVRLTIGELPPGEYAIAVVHDLNSNGNLDFNALSIPKEPYGFSNNAKGFMGPPKFKKAKFRVADESIELVINLRN